MSLSQSDLQAVRHSVSRARRAGLLTSPVSRMARLICVGLDLDFDHDLLPDAKREVMAIARAVLEAACGTEEEDPQHA